MVSGLIGSAHEPVGLGLKAEHFANHSLGSVFGAMLAKQSTDPVLIEEHLRETGELERLYLHMETGAITGLDALEMLSRDADQPDEETVREYAKIVRERGLQRQLSAALARAESTLSEAGLDAALSELGDVLGDVRAEKGGGGSDTAAALQTALEGLASATERLRPWAYNFLKRRSPGYGIGNIITVAGAPGHGKTVGLAAFAEAAVEPGLRVCFIPLEMTTDEMILRLLQKSGVNAVDIVRGGANAKPVTDRLQQMKSWGDRLTWHDDCFTMEDILAVVERHKPDVVIVDHLHELPGTEEVATITRYMLAFRQMVRRTGCSLILGAQLKKNQNDPRPTVADLKGSGSILEKSDAVFLIWRKPDSDGNKGKGAQWITAKFRHGEDGWHEEIHLDTRRLVFVETQEAAVMGPDGRWEAQSVPKGDT